MRLPSIACALSLAVFTAGPARAEPAPDAGRWSVGTSVWMLANLFPDPPRFYYLEADRRVGERGALALGALTWTYPAPIGIPYGDSHGDKAENYPGYVRSVGVGLGWRQYLFRGLNASAWSFHLLQRYHEEGRPARTGYQLFLQGRVGWRFHVTRSGLWVEPAFAGNWWPVETGRPASFKARDDRWPSYFLVEPWLNVGWSW